jgi:hypothetical protein
MNKQYRLLKNDEIITPDTLIDFTGSKIDSIVWVKIGSQAGEKVGEIKKFCEKKFGVICRFKIKINN